MKLNKLFWGLMVMALPLSFAACSSSDDENGEVDDTPYQFRELANQDVAGKYQSNKKGQTLAEEENSRVEEVEIIDNSILITRRFRKSTAQVKGVTRGEADEEVEYIAGTFTKNGDVYNIIVNKKNWGTIKIVKQGGGYSLTVTPVGEEPETVEASKSTESVNAKYNLTQRIKGTWYPYMTTINLQKQGSNSIVTDELPRIDFEAVKQRAKKEGCNISDDFGVGYAVSWVSFTPEGTFTITFDNGKKYIGDWEWVNANGGMKYDWREEGMGCEYENGQAHVDIYETGPYKGEFWLRLSNVVEQNDGTKWDVQVIFRMTDHWVNL